MYVYTTMKECSINVINFHKSGYCVAGCDSCLMRKIKFLILIISRKRSMIVGKNTYQYTTINTNRRTVPKQTGWMSSVTLRVTFERNTRFLPYMRYNIMTFRHAFVFKINHVFTISRFSREKIAATTKEFVHYKIAITREIRKF